MLVVDDEVAVGDGREVGADGELGKADGTVVEVRSEASAWRVSDGVEFVGFGHTRGMVVGGVGACAWNDDPEVEISESASSDTRSIDLQAEARLNAS